MDVKEFVNFFNNSSNFDMNVVSFILVAVFRLKRLNTSPESFLFWRVYIPDEELIVSPLIRRSITGLINANWAPMNSVKSPMQIRANINIFQCGFAYENSLAHSLIVLLFLDIWLISLTCYVYKTAGRCSKSMLSHKRLLSIKRLFMSRQIENVRFLTN